jgi:tetratricopeptide (TPR) repeat protein
MPKDPIAGPDDWFRSKDWGTPSQELFEAKLARARPASRAQYIRLKALALLEAEERSRVLAGRQLLRRVIADYGDDDRQVASAHFALGESLARDGKLDEAESHLRACLALEATGSFSHRTELRLAELLIARGGPSALDEAWELLNMTAGSGELFNNVIWDLEVARARLLVQAGEKHAATAHAAKALGLVGKQPQLPRHPTVGLVVPDRGTLREMTKLAKGYKPTTDETTDDLHG